MHQHKTIAQILLVFSVFNLAFAAPVVREIYDAHDDAMVPVVVRNVAAMSKERRTVSDASPSSSSPPPPDGSTPSGSHPSPPPPPDGSTPLQGSAPSDEPEPVPLHDSESPSLSGGPAALAVSPPGETASLPVAPASNQPVPVHPESTSQHYTAITHDMLGPDRLSPEAEMKRFQTLAKVVVIGGTIIAIAGGLLWNNRHNLRRQIIGPEWYVSKPSHLSYRRLNVPNHKYLTYEIFLSSTDKPSGHPCLDY